MQITHIIFRKAIQIGYIAKTRKIKEVQSEEFVFGNYFYSIVIHSPTFEGIDKICDAIWALSIGGTNEGNDGSFHFATLEAAIEAIPSTCQFFSTAETVLTRRASRVQANL
jgi:hypothetical protein